MNLTKFVPCAAAVMMISTVGSLQAQELQSVQESKDWTVFVDKNNSKYCYVISSPTSQRALRDGKEVQVDRGESYLYMGIKNGAPEPSFKAGYPLAGDKAVSVKIGSSDFSYVTNPSADAQFAWPQPKFDSDIVAAMKAGAEVEITGQSQRGTTTIDKYSLSGFTAAYNAAVERCK